MNFLAFHCPAYYPQGGMNDLVGAFSTLADAQAGLEIASRENFGWDQHVFDIGAMKIVATRRDGGSWEANDPS